jgi:hypothetical protein
MDGAASLLATRLRRLRVVAAARSRDFRLRRHGRRLLLVQDFRRLEDRQPGEFGGPDEPAVVQ